MLQNDTAVFHAFAWNPVKAEYDDWRGMGTRAAIAERNFEAQGPVLRSRLIRRIAPARMPES